MIVASKASTVTALVLVIGMVVSACTGGDSVDVGSTTVPSSTSSSPDTSAPDTTTTVPDPSTSSTIPDYRWAVGDCIALASFDDLPYEPFGEDLVVDCGDEHIVEVYHAESFGDGPDAPYDRDEVSETVRSACAGGFIDYVGVSYLESGLDTVFYLPDEREWAEGLRYISCVVYDPRSGEDPTTGSLRGVGATVPFAAEEGSCSNDFGLRGRLIRCDLPHRFEHAGSFTPTAEQWPGSEAISELAGAGCLSTVDGYVVGASPIGAVVGVPAAVPAEADWEAGARSIVCVAGAVDPTGETLVVIGSFAEAGWTIVEAAQAA